MHVLPTLERGAIPVELERVLRTLEQVRGDLLERERALAPLIHELPARARPSARNLVHYLALRTHDLTELQPVLARHGLSSLGRAEEHVLASLDAVLGGLRRVLGRPPRGGPGERPPVRFDEGAALRRANTDVLFGPPPSGRTVRIVATMPAEAARDEGLVRDLMVAGMDCMRINCAHDGPEAWAAMVRHLRAAGRELGRRCTVLMDIPGPRLRTGPVEPGPCVVKIRPVRDELGSVVRPARVWLTDGAHPVPPPEAADAVLPLPGEFVAALRAGDRLRFRDARGQARRMKVEARAQGGAWCRLKKTAYVVPGTVVWVREPAGATGVAARVGAIPARQRRIPLAPGDALLLTPDGVPGREAVVDGDGTVREPARISCTLPGALAHVRPGEPVWFDDGRIGGTVQSVDAGGVWVRITQAGPGGARLAADKGINLPGTGLGLPALTARDLELLPFVAEHADMTGYSFARSAADVRLLRGELERLGAGGLGIVLKVETPSAFRELPSMLLELLRCSAAGVMIARGDLAVECGFERLAEVQEEILCMCQAAHVPVVWATQVLEQLTHKGRPSRAEVSDAALGERAEAVMLNKGAYLISAVATLDDILARMSRHQDKKSPRLARLGVAEHFFAGAEAPE